MKLNTLYKRSTTGATLTWEIEVVDNKHRTHSGQVDGVITVTEWTVCNGKNEGKALPFDTYVWQMKVTYFDGRVKDQSGTVTLMK